MADLDFSARGYAHEAPTHPWWMRADDPRRQSRSERVVDIGCGCG